jgi:hypothetical protein
MNYDFWLPWFPITYGVTPDAFLGTVNLMLTYEATIFFGNEALSLIVN